MTLLIVGFEDLSYRQENISSEFDNLLLRAYQQTYLNIPCGTNHCNSRKRRNSISTNLILI